MSLDKELMDMRNSGRRPSGRQAPIGEEGLQRGLLGDKRWRGQKHASTRSENSDDDDLWRPSSDVGVEEV